MDLQVIRNNSKAVAKRLRYAVNDDLPLIDVARVRPRTELTDRLLCLNAMLAYAFGCSSDHVHRWIAAEKLEGKLTKAERDVLRGRLPKASLYAQVNGVFGLAWAGSLVPSCSFDEETPVDLVRHFPDVEAGENADLFRQKIVMRADDEIVQKADTALCLHWSIRDATIHGRSAPGKLHPESLVERRRGFAWLITEDDWDTVSLDT